MPTSGLRNVTDHQGHTARGGPHVHGGRGRERFRREIVSGLLPLLRQFLPSIQYSCFASAFAPSKHPTFCPAFLMFPIISGNLLLARSKPRRLYYIGFWYGKSTAGFVGPNHWSRFVPQCGQRRDCRSAIVSVLRERFALSVPPQFDRHPNSQA